MTLTESAIAPISFLSDSNLLLPEPKRLIKGEICGTGAAYGRPCFGVWAISKSICRYVDVGVNEFDGDILPQLVNFSKAFAYLLVHFLVVIIVVVLQTLETNQAFDGIGKLYKKAKGGHTADLA